MQDRIKTAAFIVLVSALAGLVIARRHELMSILGGRRARLAATLPRAAANDRPSSERTSSGGVFARLTASEIRIVGADSFPLIQMGTSGEGSPGIWITNSRKSGLVSAGVHGNGFPFVIASDGAVRNFGLGRVDGTNASPILVFRRDDIVRLVFGLSMTEKGRPAFLVQYTSDGVKHEVLGRYCDRPDRACVN
jgi:hypothetical protein